ncbi:MAG: JAB domain-containing protein [Dehalococcoidia bacterium]|uniref:JAB domain-containing protein n=1 Tax=Candidatus Amarobacter glycogenicus TaxID=3140699 RepID=UPI0031354353|nr:JAB domain-containing protein [Dehalococcoidia bacterium]
MDGLLRPAEGAAAGEGGWGPRRRRRLQTAIENRAQAWQPAEPPTCERERVYALSARRLMGAQRGVMPLALDTRSRLLGGLNAVVSGSANMVGLRPAEVFHEAIILDAPSVVLAHNHPSGPRPSPQDISTTEGVHRRGKILDLDVEDPPSSGTNSQVSMKRERMAFS